MAEGKKSMKDKLIKPFVTLFRKNKKDKDKANEIATNKNATTNQVAANKNATANQVVANENATANQVAANKNATANQVVANENATANQVAASKNATANQVATTNERHEEAPFDNLLKKLKQLDIDKKARLENAATDLSNDNDSICSLENHNHNELIEKFNEKTRNNVIIGNNNDSVYESDNDHAELLEKFNELEIEKKETLQVEEDEEELKKFSTKIVPDDARAARIDSQSSEDSGFTEKSSLIESDEENLDKDVDRIEQKDGNEEVKKGTKQKKLQKAYLKRGPIRSKRSQASPTAPYPCEINLNLQHHSGGQVIIKTDQFLQIPPAQQNFDSACEDIDIDISTIFSEAEIDKCLSLIQTDIPQPQFNADLNSNSSNSSPQYNLSSNSTNSPPQYNFDSNSNNSPPQYNFDSNSNNSPPQYNFDSNSNNSPPQYNFDSNSNNSPPQYNFNSNSNSSSPAQYNLNPNSTPQLNIPEVELDPPYDDIDENVLRDLDPYVLTPPSSVNSHFMYSPLNRNIESPLKSFDTTPESPALSLNDGLEQFGDIASINSPPLEQTVQSPKLVYKNLKHYKDRQKELAKKFSKMECCQVIVKSCKEIFNAHLQKLQEGDRRKLIFSVASLDMQFAFSVLMHTLSDLSSSEKPEDFKMALFCQLCEKVLSVQKTLFVEDFGLELLKLAVLRCYRRPVITRYLVECIRIVTRSDAYRPKGDTVFTEVDALGDNLLIACVRAGDRCADALRELVRADDGDVPLFDVHHVNADGYTALHACCAGHGARTARAHTLHVLLQHARADTCRQDRKGGETPLHLAVNSATCELDMVLIFFHHVDRKEWYSLAHMENRSGKNPLEYAKFGKKSRPDYPREILDFLERCRK